MQRTQVRGLAKDIDCGKGSDGARSTSRSARRLATAGAAGAAAFAGAGPSGFRGGCNGAVMTLGFSLSHAASWRAASTAAKWSAARQAPATAA